VTIRSIDRNYENTANESHNKCRSNRLSKRSSVWGCVTLSWICKWQSKMRKTVDTITIVTPVRIKVGRKKKNKNDLLNRSERN
jgi:hypothetical protein